MGKAQNFKILTAFYRLIIVWISFTIIMFTYFVNERFGRNIFQVPNTPTVQSTLKYQLHQTKRFVDTIQNDWQKLEHPDYTYYIYSAYSYDEKNVNIMAGTRPNLENKALHFRCEFSSSHPTLKNTTTKCYKKTNYLSCPLPKSGSENASFSFEFVSILLGNQTSSPVRLPIIYRDIKESASREFHISACVLPMYWYNEVFHFVEWLDFYRMMGVEHFTFYNISIGPATSCVMNHISAWSNGEVSVKVNPWHNFPQKRDNEIWDQRVGLMQGVNECSFTHKGVSNYMVYVDVDEFISIEDPNIENYHQLIQHLTDLQNGSNLTVAEFRFRNAFYLKSRAPDSSLQEKCAPFRNNLKEFQICQQLFTMKFDKREKFHPWHSRAKYISVPEGIRSGGTHYNLEFESGYGSIKVPKDIAFIRHYRHFHLLDNITTIERIKDKVGQRMVEKVAQSLQYFGKVCNLTVVQIFKTGGTF